MSLGLIQLAWKAIAIIAVVALLMAAGAAIDHRLYVTPAQKALASQKGAEQQASTDAKQAKLIQETKQNEDTHQSTQDYQSIIDRLNARIADDRRLFDSKPKTVYKYLPRSTNGSGKPAQTIGQPDHSGPSPESSPCESLTDADPCTVSRDFFNNALMDAAGVNGYSNWVTRQGFPIGPTVLQ